MEQEIARLREERDSAIDSFNAAIGRETKLINQLTEAQQEITRLRKMEAETWAKAAELVEWQANGIWFDHVREAYERAAKILRQQALVGTKEGG